MSADKQRWPWDRAHAVAVELLHALEPACERLQFAGSLRRRKATVGDVEILYVPRVMSLPDPENLFAEKMPVNLAEGVIARLEKTGVLARRPVRRARDSELAQGLAAGTSFGPLNKLMLHVASGIPVDLFAATAENWFNYLVCRTGGAENNVAIASAAQRLGWKWNPYGVGFSQEAHDGPFGAVPERVHAVSSEREVFEFVGLKYREPMERV